MFCSGDSNIEFKLFQAAAVRDVLKQANLPEVRLYKMQPAACTNNKSWDLEILDKINRL